ncbi:hypothetical protein GJAV_G00083590 [Gymnothorax javanicus]|nr:hypothetical protein GJAV_G00083590 [Gymnothorax javanicus]
MALSVKPAVLCDSPHSRRQSVVCVLRQRGREAPSGQGRLSDQALARLSMPPFCLGVSVFENPKIYKLDRESVNGFLSRPLCTVFSANTVAPMMGRLKFYYITLLRDPVSRYLSEWRHVQRGATWKTSLHMCDGRTPTPEELPSCYEGSDWSGCTLQQFMDCPYNLANNRQVRMLADLSLVGCYNMSFIPEKKRAQILLESAKKNLRDMAFFGLTEFQRKTQYLFERTFRLRFIRPFVQYNSTRAAGVDVDNDTILRIEELNDLDVQLYDYAKDLFQQRYQYKRQLDRRQQRLLQRSQGGALGTRHTLQPPDLPREEGPEEGSRLPTEDYMNHIINKW